MPALWFSTIPSAGHRRLSWNSGRMPPPIASWSCSRPRHSLSSMAFWTDQVVPRVTDKMLGNRQVMKLRRRAVDGLHGDVVEIGFGSGLNVPLYPDGVGKVYAVDPSLVARKLSSERVSASPVDVQFVGLD